MHALLIPFRCPACDCWHWGRLLGLHRVWCPSARRAFSRETLQ